MIRSPSRIFAEQKLRNLGYCAAPAQRDCSTLDVELFSQATTVADAANERTVNGTPHGYIFPRYFRDVDVEDLAVAARLAQWLKESAEPSDVHARELSDRLLELKATFRLRSRSQEDDGAPVSWIAAADVAIIARQMQHAAIFGGGVDGSTGERACRLTDLAARIIALEPVDSRA
jgi:hypothetical protein